MLKSILQNVVDFFARRLDDVLITAGCFSVLVFTYKVNPINAWLVGGIMLIAVGIAAGLKVKR